jgi:DMSO reductase anchor subunit
MRRQWWEWSWALIVMVLTGVLVGLDLGDAVVHRYWSRHSFSSSVLSGLLVLLLTVLIVDRVTAMRRLRNQSQAIGAQAAIIVAQARRAADAVTSASPSAEDREAASDELRTYAQMLLVSAPVLIDAPVPRRFLESAQRLAGAMFRALRDAGGQPVAKESLEAEVARLRADAAPLLQALNRQQRAAVTADDDDGS